MTRAGTKLLWPASSVSLEKVGWSGLLDLYRLVEAKLGSRADNDTLVLWKAIWDSYEKGGPEAVESTLQRQLKAAKSAATKELRETRNAFPGRKTKKRRR